MVTAICRLIVTKCDQIKLVSGAINQTLPTPNDDPQRGEDEVDFFTSIAIKKMALDILLDIRAVRSILTLTIMKVTEQMDECSREAVWKAVEQLRASRETLQSLSGRVSGLEKGVRELNHFVEVLEKIELKSLKEE